jgi:cytochrome c oxidase cbb3-type subunit 3
MMGILNNQEIDQVANYVIALSKGEGAKPAYAAGRAVFQKGMCFACHGPKGKPLTDLAGAANLTDGIWRFSGTKAGIVKTITYGDNVKKWGKESRLAQMPSFKSRLSEVNIKRLAVYVYELGGGQGTGQ